MDVGKLIEEIIARNEVIIRQNETLLLLLAGASQQERCRVAGHAGDLR